MSTKPRDRRLPRSFAAAALLIAALSLGSTPAQPQAQPAAKAELSLEAKVDALFAPWKSLDSPGAAVAVVKDGLVVYRKGFGSAQLEYGIPITPSTVFHVASVSKQFTAMAITMLEAEGKLSADDDIRKYLPETGRLRRSGHHPPPSQSHQRPARPVGARHHVGQAHGRRPDPGLPPRPDPPSEES